MNNETGFFIFYGILCGLAGVFTLKVHILVKAYLDMIRRRKEYPYIVSSNTDTHCKSSHTWDRTKLALGYLPVDVYTVCTSCGYISTSIGDNWLNNPALKVYQNNIKLRKARQLKWEAAFKRKQDESHQIMNNLIKCHVDQLGTDLHRNIEVLQQFFRKANIELDSLYVTLNKDIDKEDDSG